MFQKDQVMPNNFTSKKKDSFGKGQRERIFRQLRVSMFSLHRSSQVIFYVCVLGFSAHVY